METYVSIAGAADAAPSYYSLNGCKTSFEAQAICARWLHVSLHILKLSCRRKSILCSCFKIGLNRVICNVQQELTVGQLDPACCSTAL